MRARTCTCTHSLHTRTFFFTSDGQGDGSTRRKGVRYWAERERTEGSGVYYRRGHAQCGDALAPPFTRGGEPSDLLRSSVKKDVDLRVCVCVWVCVWVGACVRACVRACVLCACVSVCARARVWCVVVGGVVVRAGGSLL